MVGGQQHPVCDPAAPGERWIGKQQILMRDLKSQPGRSEYVFVPEGSALPEGVRPPREDNPKTADVDEDEIRALIANNSQALAQRGFSGICRSDMAPFKWFAYKAQGLPAFLAYYNELPPNINTQTINKEVKGFEMYPTEMVGLATALKLNEDLVSIKKGCVPRIESGSGSYTKGTYLFSKDYDWLMSVIPLLDNGEKIPGLFEGTQKKLVEHLKQVKESSPTAQSLAEARRNRNIMVGITVASSLIPTVYFGRLLVQDLLKWWHGRVAKVDAREQMEARIKQDKDFHVKGLTEMAREAWELTDDPEFRHVIVEGKTGSGKDELVNEMINLLVRHDPIVPKELHKARVYEIDVAEFQKDTKYRGTVADKIVEIENYTKDGPVVLRLKEFDRLARSGRTSEGQDEQASELLLGMLEKPHVRKNLVIIATTARGDELRIEADNLIRRMNWITKPVDNLSTVIDNLDGPKKREYEKFFGREIPKKAIEAAGRLAEVFYRQSTIKVDRRTGETTIPMPRYTAVQNVLKAAARIARKRGDKTVTIEHVVSATERLVQGPIDRSMVPSVLGRGADSVMFFDIPKDQAEANMRSIFGADPRNQQFDATRDFISKIENDDAFKQMPEEHRDQIREYAREQLLANADRLIADPNFTARPAAYIMEVMSTGGIQMRPVQATGAARATDTADSAADGRERGRWERFKDFIFRRGVR